MNVSQGWASKQQIKCEGIGLIFDRPVFPVRKLLWCCIFQIGLRCLFQALLGVMSHRKCYFSSNKYADSTIFCPQTSEFNPSISKYRTGSDHHQTDHFPTRSYKWLPSPNVERSASQASCWRPPSWRRRVVGSVPYNRQRLVMVLGGWRQGGDGLGSWAGDWMGCIWV